MNGSTVLDDETDVVIVGSGAAGMAAAVAANDAGAEVVVLESSDLLGGSTAVSGGQPWIPANAHIEEIGATDSVQDALTYLERLTRGHEPDAERLETFARTAARVVDYLERTTPLKFTVCTRFSDYHADLPGGKLRGRSLDVVPFSARGELGAWDELVRRSVQLPSATLDELSGAFLADDDDGGMVPAASGEMHPVLAARVAERDRRGIRTAGGAMTASMLKALLDRGIRPLVSSPARRLLVEDGAVAGVEVERNGGRSELRARRGVVLASGGFEWNAQMVRAYTGVTDLKPYTPPQMVGDAIDMGLDVGAALANMSVLWSHPVSYDEHSTYDGAPLHLMHTPRQQAGVILVNSRGERFVNEGIAYMHVGLAMRSFDSPSSSWPNEKAWLVFDSRARSRIALSDFRPSQPVPAWVREAPTIAGLAQAIDVPAAALEGTIARWNGQVERGADADFGRGTAWFEGWTTGGPGPELLATVSEGPFYALRMYDGANGTAGGLAVDADGRVRHRRGGFVPGLFAAGNAAASAFGLAYPGGGATIGQALTFGFLAGANAADPAWSPFDPTTSSLRR